MYQYLKPKPEGAIFSKRSKPQGTYSSPHDTRASIANWPESTIQGGHSANRQLSDADGRLMTSVDMCYVPLFLIGGHRWAARSAHRVDAGSDGGRGPGDLRSGRTAGSGDRAEHECGGRCSTPLAPPSQGGDELMRIAPFLLRLLAGRHQDLPRRGATNQPGATPREPRKPPENALKGRHTNGSNGQPCVAPSGLEVGWATESRGVAPGWFVAAPSGQRSARGQAPVRWCWARSLFLFPP